MMLPDRLDCSTTGAYLSKAKVPTGDTTRTQRDNSRIGSQWFKSCS